METLSIKSIGYLTKIKNWSEGRQIEQKTRVYEKEPIMAE